jgi:cytoskeleton protein RodZ
MDSVGQRLRKERIGQGLDLAAFSTRTRISQRYLAAIESGKVDELPSGFFYRSFVRQYATALGLDPAEIEGDLERERVAEAAVLEAALKEAEFPIKQQDPIVSESNRRYLGTGKTWAYIVLLIAVLTGCSVLYAWWHRYEAESVARREGIPQPEQTAAAVRPPQAVPALPSEPVSVPSGAVSFATLNAAPPPIVPPVRPEDRVVVRLAAIELTWISVTADGKSVFSGLLQPNQSVMLGGKTRTLLKIGNAGGLEISWNGKTLGPAGPRGQVRTLLLTPENYRFIAQDGSL